MSPRAASRFIVSIMMIGLGSGALAACTLIDNAGRILDRSSLVNDLANRLATADTLSYTAEYTLGDGSHATVAHRATPLAVAYRYPGGDLIITASATAACTAVGARSRCTLTGPSLGGLPPAALLADAQRHGFIAPAGAIRLLTAAALDASATIEEHDATIAGRHAICADVTGVSDADASAFSVCITADGLLGSFTGVVDGTETVIILDQYRADVDARAFDLPAGAAITDLRGKSG